MLLLLLLQMIGPGDGRVRIVLAWDGAREMGVSYMLEHSGGVVPCSAPEARVIPGEARCTVWIPPGPQVLRLRAETAWMTDVPCPAGAAAGRGTCVTAWSNPIAIGPGQPPGPLRITFAGAMESSR